MHPYPHLYDARASARPGETVILGSDRLLDIESEPPEQYGGPGDRWSPETLLVASVSDCFVLTFRAIAEASKLEWNHIECNATGILDRVEGSTRFTRFDLAVKLDVPTGTDEPRAQRILEKSKSACLVTNSLLAEQTLQTEVTYSNPE